MPSGFEIVPSVSVIVPAYQAAASLTATLESALAQTVRDVEVIVVDDGSTDSSADLVSKWAHREPRIQLLRQANGGVSAARNAGLRAARAPFVAFLDADDLWPPDHLAIHLGLLSREHPEPPGLSFSVARFVDATGTTVGRAKPQLQALEPADFLMANPTTTTSTWVARRSVFERVGQFDVSLRRSEDQEWLVRAALAGVRIEGTAITEVAYRTSAQGLAGDLDAMRAGFVGMLDRTARRAPELIARYRRSALAAEDRYLARQALRLGLPKHVARRFLLNALGADPLLLLRQPRSTWGTLIAALLPGPWPLSHARRQLGQASTLIVKA